MPVAREVEIFHSKITQKLFFASWRLIVFELQSTLVDRSKGPQSVRLCSVAILAVPAARQALSARSVRSDLFVATTWPETLTLSKCLFSTNPQRWKEVKVDD